MDRLPGRAQRLDASLRDALTNAQSVEVKYLRKRLLDQGLSATTEDVAAWFKGKLLEAPPVPSSAPAQMPVYAESPGVYKPDAGPAVAAVNHWLVPAGARPKITGEESLKYWLGKGLWGFWESTPGRKSVLTGDRIAFYTSDKKRRAVVAHARVVGEADLLVEAHEWPEPVPQDKPVYKVPLTDVQWLPNPIKLTELAVRARLDAFQTADPARPWGWFVVTTRRVSEADFLRLIGQRSD